MKRILITFFCLTLGFGLSAQTEGISINANGNEPDASAMLDIQSNEKGLLMPRMTTNQRNEIPDPTFGLMIYNIDDSCFNYYTGVEWVKDCGRQLTTDQVTSLPKQGGGSSNIAQLDAPAISVSGSNHVIVGGYYRDQVSIEDYHLSSNGNWDSYLVKYGPSGAVWVKDFGDVNNDYVFGSTVDSENNIVITGSYSGSLNIDGIMIGPNPAYSEQLYLIKIDPNGQAIWAKSSSGNLYTRGYDVQMDEIGNIYVTGHFSGSATFGSTTLVENGGRDIFLAKYDSDGNALWAKGYGGTHKDEGRSLAIDQSGNIYICGSFENTISLGGTNITSNGSSDIFVMKLDQNGDVIWAKQAGGINADVAYSIQVDPSGDVLCSGNFSSTASFESVTHTSAGYHDIFLSKYSPNGMLTWVKTFGGTTFESGKNITIDESGSVYMTGYFEDTLSFDTINLISRGDRDCFVTKFDSTGSAIWAKQGGGSTSDEGKAIIHDKYGNIHVSGTFYGVADFGSETLIGTGNLRNMFLWSLDQETANLPSINTNDLSSSQDADSDPTNELQDWATLPGIPGGFSDGIDHVDDADSDPTNEIQNLSLIGTQLSITNANNVDLAGIDTDTDDQTLSFSGSQLSIADGNSIDIGIAVNGGKVGIGTTSPNAPLSVVGKTRAAYDAAESEYVEIWHGGGNGFINTVGDGNLNFRHDGTNMMTVTDQKRLGIGTSAPEARLHIDAPFHGDSSGIKLSAGLYNANIFLNGPDLVLQKGNQPNQLVLESNGYIGIGTANPTCMLEVNDGIVKKIGGGFWAASSDRRLKQDIIDYQEGLSEILRIRPVRFHYNELSGYDTEEEYIGIIAQELQEIAPYMVSTFEKEGEEYLEVDNSAMIYMLINAVQEQQQMIEAFRKQNKQQKERIERLKAQLSEKDAALEARLEALETLMQTAIRTK